MATLFRIADHHAFVNRHGDKVLYYQGSPCPCGNTTDSNRARVTCNVCGGLGIAYETPVELMGIVSGIHREKNLLVAGIAQPGDMIFSPSPLEETFLSDWDQIETTWEHGHPYQGDVLRRSVDGLSDTLAYKAKSIQTCFSLDPNTEAKTAYVEGTHFSVTDRTITWVSGQPQPTAGSLYSLKYTAILAWVVFVPPMDRYEGNINLGPKVLLRPRHTTAAR
jgi:hypothetical protein